MTPTIKNQPTFATLLEENLQSEKNNLSGLLLNTTDNGQTDKQSQGQQDNQSPEQQKPDQILNSDTSADDKQVGKGQSDIVMQDIQDTALVERIFPDILAKLDGPTILKKVDGQQLLEKVLPYLDVKIVSTQRPGQTLNVKPNSITGAIVTSEASCNQGESLTGGGFDSHLGGGYPTLSYKSVSGKRPGVINPAAPDGDQWMHRINIDSDGSVTTFAECLGIAVSVKSPETFAPGGGPLLPP